jgi:hypothetical protein
MNSQVSGQKQAGNQRLAGWGCFTKVTVFLSRAFDVVDW